MLWGKFARRYMFSPKSHSVINIIASVSVLAVAIPTAAMIILMAMFDGLTSTIAEHNRAVDADIEIVPSLPTEPYIGLLTPVFALLLVVCSCVVGMLKVILSPFIATLS